MMNLTLPARRHIVAVLCLCTAVLLPFTQLLAEDTLITRDEIIQGLQPPLDVRGAGGTRQKASVTITINFQNNSAKLADEFSQRQLQETGAALASDELRTARFEIGGHTDSTGKRSRNLILSRKRAKMVRSILCRDSQVPCKNLAAKGYGPDLPVASNDDEAGRAQNRRVVITRLD